MNCKHGDLAVGVRTIPSKAANLGCVVRVIRPWPGQPMRWEVETLSWSVMDGNGVPPGTIRMAHDQYMRPIRPKDGEDETLTWAGKPQEVTA